MSKTCQTFEQRYGSFKEKHIILEKEGKKKVEFLMSKYIELMDKEFENKKYQNLTNFKDKIEKFLIIMNDKGIKNFYAHKSYRRNFDKVINFEICDKEFEQKRKAFFNFIENVQKYFCDVNKTDNIELYVEIEVSTLMNRYINKLVLQLLEIMNETNFYNYFPNTNIKGYEQFRTQLKQIEDTIETISDKDWSQKYYELWKEIIKPLQNIIKNSDFPGIDSKIWLDANDKLAYFDCVYDIANDYGSYNTIKINPNLHFNIDIEDNEETVKNNVNNRLIYFKENNIIVKKEGCNQNNERDYNAKNQGYCKEVINPDDYDKNYERESRVFFAEFKEAYKKILEKEMKI